MRNINKFAAISLFTLVSEFSFAQEAAGQPPSALASFFPLIIIFAIFYFIALRPQMKKVKAHHNMVDALKKGDKVITAGGVVGKITKLDAGGAEYIEVEIASGVNVKVVRSTVATTFDKETANDNKTDKAAAKKEPAKKTAAKKNSAKKAPASSKKGSVKKAS